MVTPSNPLAAHQPLFPLGNGGVLRSQEGEGFRKEGMVGMGRKGRKQERAKGAQKSQKHPLTKNTLYGKAAELKPEVRSRKRPPKLERRSVRANEVFENLDM